MYLYLCILYPCLIGQSLILRHKLLLLQRLLHHRSHICMKGFLREEVRLNEYSYTQLNICFDFATAIYN